MICWSNWMMLKETWIVLRLLQKFIPTLNLWLKFLNKLIAWNKQPHNHTMKNKNILINWTQITIHWRANSQKTIKFSVTIMIVWSTPWSTMSRMYSKDKFWEIWNLGNLSIKIWILNMINSPKHFKKKFKLSQILSPKRY